MEEKLRSLELHYEDLEAQLQDPSCYGDPDRLRALNREIREIAPVVETWRAFVRAEKSREEARAALSDPELHDLAKAELVQAQRETETLQEKLKLLLLPRDPMDGRSVILEVRAGVGGEESALFARALLRMYTMYAETRGWRVETVNLNETELGGVKECSLLVEGEDVWSRLKFESGVHRVQRVPETESGGRIHTSAATVAVLPEAEEVECTVDPRELQIDTFRASGAGGQHVNKTESAIRITHLPTGLVVECQDERSQYKNKEKAMNVLRARLLKAQQDRQADQTARERRTQVGSGDRSERIRTYNFPQGRVTDHRIGLTLYKLPAVLNGDLDELIDALATEDAARRLRQEEQTHGSTSREGSEQNRGE